MDDLGAVELSDTGGIKTKPGAAKVAHRRGRRSPRQLRTFDGVRFSMQ